MDFVVGFFVRSFNCLPACYHCLLHCKQSNQPPMNWWLEHMQIYIPKKKYVGFAQWFGLVVDNAFNTKPTRSLQNPLKNKIEEKKRYIKSSVRTNWFPYSLFFFVYFSGNHQILLTLTHRHARTPNKMNIRFGFGIFTQPKKNNNNFWQNV